MQKRSEMRDLQCLAITPVTRSSTDSTLDSGSYHFTVSRFALMLFWFAAFAPFTRAGLYDPGKPSIELAGSKGLSALPHEVFRDRLDAYRITGDPNRPKNKAREKALAERDELLKKGELGPGERVQLGLNRLRLREYDAAINDLQQAYAVNPRDFWTLSALGTTYLQMGQVAEAVRYLEAARDMFPESWPGQPELTATARALENTLLKLARLRLREQAGRAGRRPPPPETVDDIFGILFVGPNGEFEPGNLASDQKAKLPTDALAQVQQLLLWLPDDTRLYWLLGELYAATGDLDAAQDVLNECLDSRRFDASLLRQHRQAIREAIAARPTPPDENDWKPKIQQWLIAGLVTGPVILLLIYLQLRHVFRRPRR
jgi:tetratricopeptide (TPR) repeat protein